MKVVCANNEGSLMSVENPAATPVVILTFILDDSLIVGAYIGDSFIQFAGDNALIERKNNDHVYVAAMKVLTHYADDLANGKYEVKPDLMNASNIES
jgi:hypothetical protein